MLDNCIKRILLSNAIFSEAGEDTVLSLLSCRRKKFSSGETIYSTDSCEKSLGIILSGKVEILGAADGKNVRLNILVPGDTFGAAALFSAEEGYVSTVKAKTSAEILFVCENRMRGFIESDSAVALAYVRFLSDKIRFLNKKITSFTAKNADSAVAHFLLGQACDSFQVNMSGLSRRLDIGRTSLYRAFENLISLGAISYSDGNVEILSRNILENVGNI